MKIEILGTGCKKCTQLAAEVEQVAQQLEISFKLTKVTDMAAILGYGVMSTPAIVIDGQVKTAGSVPSQTEIQLLLQQA